VTCTGAWRRETTAADRARRRSAVVTRRKANLHERRRTTRRNFFVVSRDGSGERAITDFAGRRGTAGANALATDGAYLYFTWEEDEGDLWVMDVRDRLARFRREAQVLRVAQSFEHRPAS